MVSDIDFREDRYEKMVYIAVAVRDSDFMRDI